MESMIKHPLQERHPVDIINSAKDRLRVLADLFAPEEDGAIHLALYQAHGYFSLVESIKNDLEFAVGKLEYEKPPLKMAA